MLVSSARAGKRRGSVPVALSLALAFAALATPALADVVIDRGLVGTVETLDPQRAATFDEATILTDLFEGLVTVDALGRPTPGAAESWTVSPDGLVYTFSLRKDGRWSNGDAVKAADFVASFRRLFDPDTGATEDEALQVIKGAAPIKQGLAKPDTLGVKAVDPQTLEITLEQPTPIFPLLLADPVAMPVNVGSIKKLGANFGTTGKVVSNGPYRLAAADAEDGYVLQKNARFRAAKSIAGDSVVYRPFADAADCVAAFRAAKVETCSDVPTDALADLRSEFGTALRISPFAGTYFYVFDVAKKPFDNADIRRALSMSLDREALARDAWSGGMVPAEHLVPAGLLPEPPASPQSLDERRAAAKKVLEKAGFDPTKPGGVVLKVEIRVGTGAAHEQMARLIAAQWRSIGVDASVVTETNSDHFTRLRDGGDFDVARAGWILDEPDAADILTLFRSDDVRFNYPRYKNADFDNLLDQAAVELEDEKRQALLEKAAEQLEADMPVMPLLGYASLSLVSPKLQGWQPNLINRHPSRYLSLAP